MSTSDSRSQAASHRSTALESQAHQAVYLSTLKQFGVRWTSLRERLGSGSGTAPLGRPAVRERVVETMPGWVQKLEDVVKPSSPPLLSTLYDVISEFDELDISLQSEKAWTKPALKIFEAIWSDNLFKVSDISCDTNKDVLSELRCATLRKVSPDFVVGLSSSHIRVALNRNSEKVLAIPDIAVYLESRSEKVLYEINGLLYSPHYYSFLFVELKGPLGGAGKARLQNTTACFFALGIIYHLARLAREKDPDSFMPPTEAIRKVYGVQTLGAIWKLVVMEAQFDGVDEAAISGGMASDENGHIDLSPHLFVVTTLWTGDLLDPQALLELVIILRDVRDEQIVRHELIGNWLYCLRDQDAPPARSRRRKPIATGSDSARAIKKSRNERGTDGGRIGPPGGDQSDSGLGLKSVGSTVADKLSRPSLHLDSIRNIMPLRDSTSYVVDWLSEQDSSSPQSSSGDFIEDTALPSKPPAPAAIVG